MQVVRRTGFSLRFVTAVCLGFAPLVGSPAEAQTSTVEFTVSGTSTIRGWTCTVSGTAEVAPGSSSPAPGFAEGVRSASLTVPVADFDCPDETMIEHLLDAMKPAEFPEITLRARGLRSLRRGRPGQRRPHHPRPSPARSALPISLSPSGGGVEIAGEVSLDMTAYGVEPPVVMLGLLRVRPQIRIQFEGLVVP